jgi:hypothetical protein
MIGMKPNNNPLRLLLILLPALSTALHAQVQSTTGLKLVANGSLKLVFHDASLVNNGEFMPGNSTVIFSGSASRTFIGGSNPVSFQNLVLSKPGQELELRNNVRIACGLTMEQGNLQLNSHLLDLGYTGRISGERNDSRITGRDGGTVKATALLNAPRSANPGNMGVEISSGSNLGETIFLRGHSTGFTAEGREVIHRYFDIKPQQNSYLRATLKFHYLDVELNSDEGALAVFSRKDGQAAWLEKGKDYMDPGNNWIVMGELDQLHRFTLAGATNKALVRQPGTTTVQIFPNPTPDQFTVMLNTAEEKKAVLHLYDPLGRLLESRRIQCRAGMNIISWSIARYAAGSYYLSFENLNLKTINIVKQ